MTLGQRIQELRKQKGLSQEGLGELLGVSRQAISRWEMDGAVPEVDKLIAMSKLFGVTLNHLLGVEEPALPAAEPAPRAGGELRPRRLLAGALAACLALGGLSFGLWREKGQLERQMTALAQGQERVYTTKPLFASASCTLSDLELGFHQGHGSQTLTVTVTAEPVEELAGWEFLGLTAVIDGHDPWARPGEEGRGRDWTEERTVEMRKNLLGRAYTGKLVLEEYGGEEIVIGASFRDPVTGLTADMEELFRVDYTKSREGYHYIQSVTARDGRRISAVPPMLELQLPDPRFS